MHKLLVIRESVRSGRGVFARHDIASGTVVEESPVIVVSHSGRPPFDQERVLDSYYFRWGGDHLGPAYLGLSETGHSQIGPSEMEPPDGLALALGYGSLFNHASPPNAVFECRFDSGTIVFTSCRQIAAGEEVLIDYTSGEGWGPLWFAVKEP